MKSIVIVSFVLGLSFTGWAATKGVPVTNHVLNAAARSNMLAKTGGFIMKPATGPKVTFVNLQKRVPRAAFSSVEERWEQILRLPHQILERESTDALKLAAEMAKNSKYAVVIVVADQPGLPSLLVAPEARWAVVNVAALEPDQASPAVLASRLRKEMSRAYGYTMGAINTSLPACVLKPIFGVQDLDAMKYEYVGVEASLKVLNQARKMGIESSSPTTYKKAVEEGWAPTPTNQWQRAVWETTIKGSVPGKQ